MTKTNQTVRTNARGKTKTAPKKSAVGDLPLRTLSFKPKNSGALDVVTIRTDSPPTKSTPIRKILRNYDEEQPGEEGKRMNDEIDNENRASRVKLDNGARQERYNIFIRNLSYNTTEDRLVDLFSDCGNILALRILTDDNSDIKQGFAFIDFDTAEAVDRALLFNDTELDGRMIRVSK